MRTNVETLQTCCISPEERDENTRQTSCIQKEQQWEDSCSVPLLNEQLTQYMLTIVQVILQPSLDAYTEHLEYALSQGPLVCLRSAVVDA